MHSPQDRPQLVPGLFEYVLIGIGFYGPFEILEGRLIKEYRPRYNVSFRDDKRFLLVKVDLQDEWPRFRLTRVKNPASACML
jgi:hypothetical protein